MRDFSATTRSPTSPASSATVGALRAEATDVDTTLVSYGTGKFKDEGIVTTMTLVERMANRYGDGEPSMSDLPFHVLPELDDTNRFFWTSGEDGLLRFLGCEACGYLLHPPGPRCPECGGADLRPRGGQRPRPWWPPSR